MSTGEPAYLFLADGEREEAALTWGELDLAARRIAAALQAEGRAGERTLLLYPPGLDFITAFIGCLYAGVVAVPAYPPHPSRPDARLRSILRHAEPALALTTAALLPQLRAAAGHTPELARLACVATDRSDLPAGDEWRQVSPAGEDLAFLQYTSGSTAEPKGVMVSHANLMHNERMIRHAFRQSEGSVIVGWLPLYHDMGLIGNVLQPVYAGARCILMSPGAFLQSPARWLRAVSRYAATTSGGPDFAYDLCVRKIAPEQREGLDLSAWSIAFNGAEPVRPGTLDRFAEAFAPHGFRRQAFYPCYGLAEATLFVTGARPGQPPTVAALAAAALEEHRAVPAEAGTPVRHIVSCGRPWLGQRIAVVDPETGAPCPPGGVGEVWIAGASVAAGYWGQPEESAATFRAALPGSRRRFLRTGDLGFLQDGELFLTGRLKDLIILRGRNLYPQDLELTAERSHPALRPGCGAAFSVDSGGEERLVVVHEVQRHHGDLAEVAEMLRRAVAEEHAAAVADVILLRTGTLPKTSSGKIRRRECRTRYLAGTLEAVHRSAAGRPAAGAAPALSHADLLALAPRDRAPALDAWLLAEVARRAGVAAERISPQASLVSSGLDSLAAIELEAQLAAELGLRLSGATLLELSVAELRERILERLAAASGEEEELDLPPFTTGEALGDHPLSQGQRAIWFLQCLTPDSAVFNLAAAARLGEGMDEGALLAALAALVELHPALRTTIAVSDGEPRQRVHGRLAADVLAVDAAAWNDSELAAALRREARRRFDLESGGPLRVRLFAHGGERVLLLVIHHLACDFWSLSVLLRDWAALYAREREAGHPPLPEIPASYPDFVRWQEQMLAGPAGQRLERYWLEHLRGAPFELDLPTDRPRPPVQTYDGGLIDLVLDGELRGRLHTLGRANGATLFATLLAAFQALLGRIADRREILVGTPATARRTRELDGVVGYFVNPVVLRGALGDDPSFAAFVARTQATVTAARLHRDLPFPLLAERLQPPRDPGRPPLFQVAFTLQKAASGQEQGAAAFALGQAGVRIEIDGLVLESLPLDRGVSQFDLTLFAAEINSRLVFAAEYNTALFDATTVHRLLASLRTLLAAAAAEPEARLSDLPLLSTAERCEVIALGQGERTEYPGPVLLHDLVQAQARRTPESVAVVSEDESVVYAELAQRAALLAGQLRKMGVGPEVPVGVYMERSVELVVALLGVLTAGGFYVPLDPGYPHERLAMMAEDCRPAVLLTGGQPEGELLAGGARILPLPPGWGAGGTGGERGGETLHGGVDPLQLAYVIYTSGSTGRPKGAMNSHLGIRNRLLWMQQAYGLTPDDRVLQKTPFSFDVSVWELFWPLLVGARLVLARPGEHRDPDRLVETLLRQGITTVHFVPSMLQAMLEEPRFERCADLRRVLCSGEALTPQLAERFFARLGARGPELHNLYGPTEAAVDVTFHACGPERGQQALPIGRPIANTGIHILDRALRPCPPGIAGELCIAGVALGRGYWRRPDLTAAAFVPDPSSAAGERVYRTGDLARMRPAGEIEYLGRIDRQVKVRGFRIELAEIEAVLSRHPGVAASAVVAVDHGQGDQRLVAYAVPSLQRALPVAGLLRLEAAGSLAGRAVHELPNGMALWKADLLATLRRALPEHMVPGTIVPLAALPLTPSGKLDRRALPAPTAPALAAPHHDGRNEMERMVAGIWCEVLGLPHVGREDNFFDLGGHSLLLPKVQARLRAALGREIGLVDLLGHHTVRALADSLGPPAASTAPARRSSPVRPGAANGDIAIIGASGRFPGAASVARFWENIRNGVSSIARFDAADLQAAGVDPALLGDPRYVPAGGALDGVGWFDADFFGYSPREAEVMDPQHRLFLECAWEALEDAGYDSRRVPGPVGVFASLGINVYLLHLLTGLDLSTVDEFQVLIGNDKDFLPTRVSYKLDLRGPSMAVQTACSSSLVGVHLACRHLFLGECDMALAGGVSIALPQRAGYLYQEGDILSPAGSCRAFDAEARGTVRGSGAGIVVLKRLDDALAHGDSIRAVIKGSAVNNDGVAKAGYTAPSAAGQAAVISAALAAAGVDPATIGYVEAHGTGTRLGDPIEVRALTEAFRQGGARRRPCALGSVKTNVGHLDAAAGVTGLIKTTLALQHRELPPSLGFSRPNPEIDFAASPFYVNAERTPWEVDTAPRRAGVSSFGIGGTNAHVVLEEPPPVAAAESRRGWHLFALSARTPAALAAVTTGLGEHFALHPEIHPADAAYTLQVGRRPFAERRFAVCCDLADAAAVLAGGDPERLPTRAGVKAAPPVVFLFPGQGSQHPGMSEGLYRGEPAFRREVDLCCDLLAPHLGLDLRSLLFSLRAEAGTAHRLERTEIAQPALFVVEYALARLWMEWGVQPQAMIGHSLGEYVAACLAGVFSLEDALALVAARGRMTGELPGGAMLAVSLPEREAAALATGGIALAAVNAPGMTVLSGPAAAIESLAGRLTARGVDARRLRTSHAFHSAALDPVLDRFGGECSRVRLRAPAIPYLSNVTGGWVRAEEATDPRYWVRHLRQTVRFADGVAALLATPGRAFLEVGPGRSLSSFVSRQRGALAGGGDLVTASLPGSREGKDEVCSMLTACGHLWSAGVEVDWPAFHAGEKRRRVSLPTYPFERRRFWIDRGNAPQPAAARRRDPEEWVYAPSWRRTPPAPHPAAPADDHPWLLFADPCGVAEALVERLARSGRRALLVREGVGFARIDGGFAIDPLRETDYDALAAALRELPQPPEAIVHAWGLTPPAATASEQDLERALERGPYSLLHLARALSSLAPRPLRLTALSSGLHEVTGSEEVRPDRAGLLAVCRVLAREHPEISCRSVDLEAAPAGPALRRLADRLAAELSGAAEEPVVAYRGEHRWVQSYEPMRSELAHGETIALREGGVYLITGGLGRLGLALAEHLAASVRARLVLVGRSPLPERDEWPRWALEEVDAADGLPRKIRRLLALEGLGAEVLTAAADVADPRALEEVLRLAEDRFGPLHGAIHAASLAGERRARPIAETGPDDCRAAFHPKVHGAMALAEVLRGKELDFVVALSSLAGILGRPGSAAAAMADLCLDALALCESRAGSTPWISIAWDDWRFPGEDGAPPPPESIAPEEGGRLLQRILASGPPAQLAVSTTDLGIRLELPGPAPAVSHHPRPTLDGYAAPRNDLETALAALWQDVLGIESVGVHDNFFELGGHSLMAIRLLARVREALGVEITQNALFARPTVAGLAHAVAAARSGERETAGETEPPPLERDAGEEPPPLSFAQERYWFLDRLEPGSAAYNILVALRLTGGLQTAALAAALRATARRHPALRTAFEQTGRRPVQRVLPDDAIALPVIDLAALPEEAREAEARRIAVAEKARPFDLTVGRLFRPRLLRLAEREHLLVIATHHIVFDGSHELFVRELGGVYAALLGDSEALAPEPPVDYGDFARWERRWLSGPVLEEHLAYWRQRLHGEIPVLELPVDRRPPAVRRGRGAGLGFALSAQLTGQLQEVARAQGATLYMVLLAGFQALLHRYTEQPSIWVGSPVAARPPVAGKVIGCFINTLVLRADPTGGMPFSGLLAEVRESALGAYRHRYLPFDVLVRALRPDRDLARTPLFQTMIGLTRTESRGIALPGLAVSFEEFAGESARFDLLLAHWEGSGEGLGGFAEFDRDLFDPPTILRLLEHFRSVLAQIAARPEERIADLALLGEAERHQLALGWNDTAREYDRGRCLQDLFAAQAARRPDAVAVVAGGEELCYGELERRANRLAHRLIALGAGPSTFVGVHLERSAGMVVALLAVLKAGAAYVPLDLSSPEARLRRIAAVLEMRHLVTQTSRQGTAEALGIAHEVCLDGPDLLGRAAAGTDRPPAPRVTPRHPAYVIFTSGSTGAPKGVAVCHRPVVNLIEWAGGTFGLGAADRGLFVTSLGFDLSVFDVFGLLAVGGSVRVAADLEVEDPRALLEILRREPVTFWNSAPAVLQQLVPFFDAVPPRVPRESRLRLVFLSGDWIPVGLPDQVRAAFPRAEVVALGGATEATVWSNAWSVGRVEPAWASIPYGRPIQNARYHVFDASLELCPIGVAGDLYIGGDCLAEGYAREPVLTAAAFIPDGLGGAPGGRLYRTGDRARFWAGGVIEFLGRRDHQVKIRGFRIELGEIESALADHPGVREAVTLARQDGPGGKRLVAYAVARCEPGPTPEELRRHLAARLPEYMVPSTFVSLPALPLTANGKVDRGALPAPEQARPEALQSAAAPGDLFQETLAAVWTEVLGREQIAPTDDFFELGGDSLLATHLVSRLREVFGVELPVRKVFEAPVLTSMAAELAAGLRQERGHSGAPLEHVPHGGRAPVSFSQERLWFLDQLYPGSHAYNIPAAFRLSGQLEVAALAAVAGEIVRRHESLRTTFAATDLGVFQVIAPPSASHLPIVDLSGLATNRREAVAQELARSEAERPFDLARGPLLRLTLLRLGEREHAALVTMHHIVSDAWSMAIFIREFAVLYAAFAQGLPSPLPEMPVQYADYARWQRQWLQGELLEGHLAYWTKHLAGAPPILDLPTDRPRPAVLTYRGAVRPIAFREEMSRAVADLGRRHGATLFMTLLAAFEVLLLRYTGREDLIVGAPIANRTRVESEGLIGFFINSLALRTDLADSSGFTDLLARVREVALGAYVHQDLPFEKLVDELQPERKLSHSPLFQVLFQFQLIPLGLPALPGLALSSLAVEERTAKLDLVLSLEETDGQLRGVWRYKTELFDAATIARMTEHLRNLISALIESPGRALWDLPLVDRSEQHQLIAEWNDSAAAGLVHTSFVPLFSAVVARWPDAVALIADDLDTGSMTYRELDEHSGHLARLLLAQGAGRETLVGVLCPRGAGLVIAILAIWKAGGAYLPLDPIHPARRHSQVLSQSGASFVLAAPAFLPVLTEAMADLPGPLRPRVLALDASLASVAGAGPAPAGGEGLAYVLYTSGSTGQPKGAMVEQQGMVNHLLAKIRDLTLHAGDTVAQTASQCFDISIWQMFAALAVGGRMRLFADEVTHDPPLLLDRVEADGVTVLEVVPSAQRVMLDAIEMRDAGAPPLARLRFLILTGEALPPDLCRRWLERYPGVPMVNAYGPTECSDDVTHALVCEPPSSSAARIPIGRPVANMRLHVLDRCLGLAPLGIVGELCAGGVGVGRGYFHDPVRTATAFIPDPLASEPGARLYRTGDLVHRLPSGELDFLGRVDHQVKVRGFRIELGEIEAALGEHPAVRECVVVVREARDAGGGRVVAFIVPEGNLGTVTELRRWLAARLPDYMLPASFVQLPSLPLTPNGKVDRRALPATGEERPDLDRVFVEPRNALERALARSWCQILGLEQVGVHDNFFELGGNSIKAAILANRLQEELGSILYVVAFFDAPTIDKLAAYLRARYPEAVARLYGEPVAAPAPSPVRPPARVDAARLEQLQGLVRLLPPAAAGHGAKNPPAVFVLAPPRSGSTLLRVMLAGHPQLFAPPELELLSFDSLGARKASFQGRDSFWLEGLIRAVMEVNNCDADKAKTILAQLEDQDISSREIYRLLQDWIGDRLLVDKTSTYAFDPRVLARAETMFAEPRYIHLIRHPYGMIRSFEKAGMDEIYFRDECRFAPRELAELIWTLSHRNILDFLAVVPPGRHLAVRFEDLVHQPRETLRAICGLLGLDFHPDMVRPYEERAGRMTDGIYHVSRMLGDVKFHQHTGIDASVAEHWRADYTEDFLGDITWDLAASLGYPREACGLTAIERATREDGPLPLSFAQERLWFLDQLQPGTATYNLPAVVRAVGPLSVPALAASLREVANRHESLRTTFVLHDRRPAQKIAPASQVALPVIDLEALPATVREAEALRLAAEEAERPFDLAAGPLLRASLSRLSGGEHVLSLVMHHIVSDGWSMGVLVRDVAALYGAISAGESSPLPLLPVQYADYAQWQRRWLAGGVLAQQIAYWKDRLTGLPILQLPVDRPRPIVESHRGATRRIDLPLSLRSDLEALAQGEGASLFMALLAGFTALLGRYSGQVDFAVGSPLANRNRVEIEHLIGFFINTLVLRIDLDGDPPLRELLARTRRIALEGYAHQDVPFEILVDELRPDRDLSYSPLFQVMLALQNASPQELALPGIALEPLQVGTRTAKFDLTVLVEERAGGLTATLEYASDLFDHTTVERMARHLQALLAGAAAGGERRLSDLPLLSAQEEQQLLVEWNDTELPENGAEACLQELFEAQVERSPNALAVIAEGGAITYRELDERANRLAHFLRRAGIGPEIRVGVCPDRRSPDLVVALLGVLKAGGAWVPLDATYPRERLAFTLADARATLVLAAERSLDSLPDAGAPVFCLDRDRQRLAAESAARPPRSARPRNLAYVIYTSGSTGRPKGVAIEHRSPVALVRWAADEFSPRELAGVLASTSICFDLSIFEIFVPLCLGGTVVLADNALHLRGLPAAGRVTLINTVPSAMVELLRGDGLPGSLRTVNLAGEPLPGTLVRDIYERSRAERVLNLFGPSEDTTYSTWARVPRGEAAPAIGRPVAGTRAHVVDRALRLVPSGAPGELLLAGAGLARGYLERPELTAGRFLPDPFSAAPGERLYRTGDLVRYRRDGELEFLGRIDHQVKVRGFRIELAEIEACLLAHPAVREAVVVAREDAAGDRRLAAYVVTTGQAAPATELRSFLAARLPSFFLPAHFVTLPELPLTPNGKIDRRALPPPLDAAGGSLPAAPRSNVEAIVAGIWCDVLRLPVVTGDVSFFDLGGHSLLAAQVASRVREALGADLPLRSVFQNPTLSGLAAEVERLAGAARGARRPTLERAPRTDAPLPLAFSQEPFWFLEQLTPGNPMHHITSVVRLTGRVEVTALAWSVDEIVRRHESLRTGFSHRDSPVQIVYPADGAGLLVVDLRDLAPRRREEEQRRVATRDARQPFDLARPPLLRVLLLELAPEHHTVILDLHHIIADGWSIDEVLVPELATLYGSMVRGTPARLADLPIQYGDFVHWQRDWLQGEVAASHLAYWRRHLAGAPPLLELPTDRPRPAFQTYRGGFHSFAVAPEQVGELEAFGRREGVSFFMTCLAAFQILLYRCSGQTEIVVGTGMANRVQRCLEGLIGLFFNTVALRTSLEGDPTVRELLARVRETCLDAEAHQDVPLGWVIEELRLERDPSYSPLFQVMLMLRQETRASIELPGLSFAPLEVETGGARVDLCLFLHQDSAGLRGTFEYNADLFEPRTIAELGEQLELLFAALPRDPLARISDPQSPDLSWEEDLFALVDEI